MTMSNIATLVFFVELPEGVVLLNNDYILQFTISPYISYNYWPWPILIYSFFIGFTYLTWLKEWDIAGKEDLIPGPRKILPRLNANQRWGKSPRFFLTVIFPGYKELIGFLSLPCLGWWQVGRASLVMFVELSGHVSRDDGFFWQASPSKCF